MTPPSATPGWRGGVRRTLTEEQRTAARLGQYAAIFQLDPPSAAVKVRPAPKPEADLLSILQATRPRIVYTHNPADKHATHIGVLNAALRALRQLPPDGRPEQLLGCEVWRDLDWLCDEDKTILDVSGHEDLAQRLNAVFASQIAGGKRYDLAIQGRRRANATFFQSHAVDACDSVCFAIDLTPQTLSDNARFFPDGETQPHHVITMGIGTILDSRRILLLAFGANKADAVAAAAEGPITANVPASALQFHAKTHLFLDEPAAVRLTRADYYRWVYDQKPDWQR